MKKLFATGLAAAALAASPALADFPEDGPISFVIPYSPGGGFDTIVRQFAPALGEAMGATVVPENISGAGGTRGAQSVFRADPDGYTIGIFNIPGFTVNEVLGRDQGFALSEVTWLANLAIARYALAVPASSDINSVEDLCAGDDPVKFSDTGATSTASVTTRIAMSIIGCDIIDVTGYSGSNDAMIAVISGEVDATIKPISSLAKYLEGSGSGDLKLILTLSAGELVEGVQNATDIGYPQLANFTLARVIGGPPGMPAEVVSALEEGLRAAGESEAVTSWAEGAGVDLEFMGAADTTAMMNELSTFYQQYADIVAVEQ
ncbi:Bug family tripartite tricarboxylate transporter substrate binding protein [Ovoidimarina sediminis]|uniref:Bug family tripartite tricarboxylate transporter substrate binding protein n=1 Tax=Ovoidimarina sediminis TaxID=3079856 RepID=UPI0029070BBE|nr:tripartite tricarboxylate transporter substrate binding protein [Rhodophyticola sp. MJ-SS7]MDU8941798.1 tripartite tricarboxylate transporter substrate binding protein [Rhodophyticola sp. MJ-SS7]